MFYCMKCWFGICLWLVKVVGFRFTLFDIGGSCLLVLFDWLHAFGLLIIVCFWLLFVSLLKLSLLRFIVFVDFGVWWNCYLLLLIVCLWCFLLLVYLCLVCLLLAYTHVCYFVFAWGFVWILGYLLIVLWSITFVVMVVWTYYLNYGCRLLNLWLLLVLFDLFLLWLIVCGLDSGFAVTAMMADVGFCCLFTWLVVLWL